MNKEKVMGRNLLLLIFLSMGIYLNTLWNPFVWDDVVYVSTNAHFEDSRYIPEYFTASFCKGAAKECPYYRPVVSLSYLVDYMIWGKNSFGYHLSNILIHVMVVMLFYIVSMQLFRNPLVSMVGALIFAVHPVHVESVAVVANRTDPLTSISLLLSLYFFHRHFFPKEQAVLKGVLSPPDTGMPDGVSGQSVGVVEEPSLIKDAVEGSFEEPKRHGVVFFLLSLLFFSLALLTKEVAVLLPILFLFYDFFFVRSWKGMGDLFLRWKTYLPFGIVLILYFIARHHALGYGLTQDLHMRDVSLRVLAAPSIVWDYFRLQLFPYPLKLYHGRPEIFGMAKLAVVWGVLFMGLYLFVLFKVRRYSKEVTFFGLWFLMFLLPVINLVPIAWPMVSERYSYIPSMGIALMMGYMGHRIWGSQWVMHSGIMRKGFLGLFVTILVTLSLMTIMRNQVWSDEIRLWSDAVQKSPDFAMGHMNLGLNYHKRGQMEKAALSYKKAIELNPLDPKAHHNLGALYKKLGRTDQALSMYQELIDQGKGFPATYFNMGTLYKEKGDLDQAVTYYREALRKNPEYYKASLWLGRALVLLGREEKALDEFSKAVRIFPKKGGLYLEMAELLRSMNRIQEAEKAYRLFLDNTPLDQKRSREYFFVLNRLKELTPGKSN